MLCSLLEIRQHVNFGSILQLLSGAGQTHHVLPLNTSELHLKSITWLDEIVFTFSASSGKRMRKVRIFKLRSRVSHPSEDVHHTPLLVTNFTESHCHVTDVHLGSSFGAHHEHCRQRICKTKLNDIHSL